MYIIYIYISSLEYVYIYINIFLYLYIEYIYIYVCMYVRIGREPTEPVIFVDGDVFSSPSIRDTHHT